MKYTLKKLSSFGEKNVNIEKKIPVVVDKDCSKKDKRKKESTLTPENIPEVKMFKKVNNIKKKEVDTKYFRMVMLYFSNEKDQELFKRQVPILYKAGIPNSHRLDLILNLFTLIEEGAIEYRTDKERSIIIIGEKEFEFPLRKGGLIFND